MGGPVCGGSLRRGPLPSYCRDSDCGAAGVFTERSMILRANLPKLREVGGRSARVLDAGGWYRPFNLATHVIDLNPYESRRLDDALDPEDDERFTADTWIVQDVCNSPWPFPDKTFDFVVCSHLLEDVRDPITVCRELCRVGKAVRFSQTQPSFNEAPATSPGRSRKRIRPAVH